MNLTPAEILNLTPRQAEVMQGVWRGWTDKRIGFELAMSESTASVHVKALRIRLGVESRVELALIWERRIKEIGTQKSEYRDQQRGATIK